MPYVAQDASQKQVDYIIDLANQLTGRHAKFLSQVDDVVLMTRREKTGGMTKAEASAHIRDLLARLKAEEVKP